MKCLVQISTICIVASFLPHLVKSEFYTAMHEMEKLLHTEGEIARTLENYLKVEEERLEKIKWLSKQYAKLHTSANKDVEKFLSNPVNAYLLVKRLTADWDTANRLIEGSDSRAVINNITAQILNFPNNEDLYGAATALIRLQETYLLDTGSIARGEIKGTTPVTELTAGDCFELGRQAYKAKDFVYSMQWMQESMNRTEKEDVKTANRTEILEYMAYAAFVLKNYTTAVQLTEELIDLAPDHPRAMKNLVHFRIHEANMEAEKRAKGDRGEADIPVEIIMPDNVLDPAIIEAYEKLCRGESLKTPAEESKLHCYYTTNNNSYLLLQPIKVEVLNLKPRIVVYYDALKDWEANALKSLAAPKLERATVSNATTGEMEFANYRISKSAWLHDYEHHLIPRLNQRIEDLTGMDTGNAEALHVINYGIGGHYEPHFDYAGTGDKISFLDDMGNRIATFIFYLTDVPAGGSTVFPTIGVEVKPIKGAAVFWYNLHKNGTGNEATRHAGCPVLAGSKWISNKWLHEAGNEFSRPCSLDPLK